MKLRCHAERIKINQQTLNKAQETIIKTGDRVQIDDFSFVFAIGSDQAEALAQCAVTDMNKFLDVGDNANLLRCDIQHGATNKTIWLYPAIKYILGSARHCNVVLNVPAVEPEHLALTNQDGAIRVEPIHGEVKIDSVSVGEPRICTCPCKLIFQDVIVQITVPLPAS